MRGAARYLNGDITLTNAEATSILAVLDEMAEHVRAAVEDIVSERGYQVIATRFIRAGTLLKPGDLTLKPEALLEFFQRLAPGHLHRVLAGVASRRARLVTVNFDDLAEQCIPEGAWTVDLQEQLNEAALERAGAAIKLHGTQRVHHGADRVEQRGSSRLQATIASIVASGGGAGLRPDIEERLRRSRQASATKPARRRLSARRERRRARAGRPWYSPTRAAGARSG
jgi:hypothetical protein